MCFFFAYIKGIKKFIVGLVIKISSDQESIGVGYCLKEGVNETVVRLMTLSFSFVLSPLATESLPWEAEHYLDSDCETGVAS